EPRNLSRREAEVALRATNSPDEHLFGRKLTTLDFRPYARAELAAAPEALTWIEYGNRDCSQPAARWLQRTHPGAQPQASVPTPLMMLRAVEMGLGAGLVPSVVAETSPDLVKLSED